jgi:hypothetical protein
MIYAFAPTGCGCGRLSLDWPKKFSAKDGRDIQLKQIQGTKHIYDTEVTLIATTLNALVFLLYILSHGQGEMITNYMRSCRSSG